jgi:NAD(P)-dependent dehydrogenase (short-subunit alcohol dehydrogenase family)
LHLQFWIFVGLDAALWGWARGRGARSAVPARDAAFGAVAALSVAAAWLAGPPAEPRAALVKSPLFKRLGHVVALAELVVFLVVPWVLIIWVRDTDMFAHVLASHLFIVQVQIALEPVLIAIDWPEALFWYITATNAYRGVGIATSIARYLEARGGPGGLNQAEARFMDVYMILAFLVWLGTDVFLVVFWRPALRKAEYGLRTYKDAVVIITGSASGIGRALAEDIARRGAGAVVLVDRQQGLLEEVSAGLEQQGADTSVYNVDVRNYSEVKRVVDETKQKYGRVDYMFNNAGILIIGPIESLGVENFDYIFDVNVKGVHHGVQAAYPVMKEQGFGHIVNTSSFLGLIPGGRWAVAYSASKHAVVGLSTNLRIEAASHRVRVSLFCPGSVETPIHTGGVYGKNLTGIPQGAWEAQVAKMHGMDAKACAAEALDAVARNEPIIVVPQLQMLRSRLLYRLSPSLWLNRSTRKAGWVTKLQKSVAEAQGESKKDD